MAITILSTPNNPIEPIFVEGGWNNSYTLNSGSSSFCSMKYVGELYVNNELITRIKNSPNLQDGKCVITPWRILEDYVSSDRYVGLTPSFFQKCTNSQLQYKLIFGEELDGTLDCTGSSFNITFGPSASRYGFNGTLQYGETWNYLDWFIEDGNSDGRFLTNAPKTQDIDISENSFLYYIAASQSAGSGQIADSALEVIVNNGNKTQTWYVLNYRVNNDYDILAIGCGPADLNYYVTQGIVRNNLGILATQSIITCDTIDYKVRITDYELVG